MEKSQQVSFVTMPYSLEAEQAVLGAMIVDRETLNLAVELLNENDFFIEKHQLVFSAIVRLFSKNIPLDLVTLLGEMGSTANEDAVYITGLLDMVYSTQNARHYISIVEGKSMLRGLIKAADGILGFAYAEEDDVGVILDRSEQMIFEVVDKRGLKGFSHIRDVLADAVMEIERVRVAGKKITGVPTGFNELDGYLSGLHNSDLILIAARPGVGKTSFALNIAQNVAIKADVPVAVFSLEMSKEQLVSRILWSEALVDSEKMRTGELTVNDRQRIAHALGRLSKAPIYIDDTPSIGVNEIMAKCRRLKQKNGLGLVIIDYLQLMQPGGRKSDNRQNEVAAISRALKIFAKDLNIPVITLSQLSRESEKRQDKRPQLSDLRDSGAIEQDADIVMFLYRDDMYNSETEFKNVAELKIAKHRNGQTGVVTLVWRGEYTTFMTMKK